MISGVFIYARSMRMLALGSHVGLNLESGS